MAMHLNLKPCHSQNLFLIFFAFLYFISLNMSDSAATPIDSAAAPIDSAASPTSTAPTVNIVFTEKPEGEDPEPYYIRILSAVLGSEEAAKEALLYSYKNAASGFSAKLTPQQVIGISKQPGVLKVVPSRTLQIHSGGTSTRPHSVQ
ncbi:unnamed protein product [Lupinus luteus]|uniref:Inhibitor I9 domain-containing protein n=1 Tax=Lupinus luteus TaxID=3873 RepID=A0AAV1YHS9_LUPLU